MKLVFSIVVLLLILLQVPLALEAYDKSQQCRQSAVKQASSKLGELLPDLDMVDCSFMHYYRSELDNLISG